MPNLNEQECREAFEAGETLSAIAARNNCRVQDVSKVLGHPVIYRRRTEEISQMATYFDYGMSYAEIAALYGISRQAVQQRLTQNKAVDGFQARKAARNAAIVADLKTFGKLDPVASRHGLKPVTVARIARPPGAVSEQRRQRNAGILQAAQEGKPYGRIAETFQVTYTLVQQVLKAAGYKRLPRKNK